VRGEGRVDTYVFTETLPITFRSEFASGVLLITHRQFFRSSLPGSRKVYGSSLYEPDGLAFRSFSTSSPFSSTTWSTSIRSPVCATAPFGEDSMVTGSNGGCKTAASSNLGFLVCRSSSSSFWGRLVPDAFGFGARSNTATKKPPVFC